MGPAVFLGQHHQWEVGMWLSSALCVPAHPCRENGTQQRPLDIPSDLSSHKAAQDPRGISQPRAPVSNYSNCGSGVLRGCLFSVAPNPAGTNLGHGAGLGRALSHPGFPADPVVGTELSQRQQGPLPAPGVLCWQSRLGVLRAGGWSFPENSPCSWQVCDGKLVLLGQSSAPAGGRFGMFGAADDT